MKAGIIGNGPHVEARAESVRALGGVALAEHLPEATAAGVLQRREAAVDVVFVCGDAGRRVQVAEAALRQGRHVFLEWPPAASVQELERLAERAEEAGAEVGVSRPLRFHPLFDAWPADEARAEVLSVQECRPRAPRHAHLADALDVCCALGGSVQRLDAQAARSDADAGLEAVAAGVRFHSGAYAQVHLRRALARSDEADQRSERRSERRFYAAGPGLRLAADLDTPEVHVHRNGASAEGASAEGASAEGASAEGAPPGNASSKTEKTAPERSIPFPETLRRRETRAFLEALRDGLPAPVSILDALAAMRLTERLMQQLR